MKLIIVSNLLSLVASLELKSPEKTPSLKTQFDNCSLASQLLSYGGNFNNSTINDWVCLTFYESHWNTAAKARWIDDGSYDWGLFQINDNYYCYSDYSNKAAAYNLCGLDCSLLVDDDIEDDSACASIIYEQRGFGAWNGWKYDCKDQDLSAWTEGCDL